MKKHLIPLSGGMEDDALTRWRKVYHWRAGVVRWIKKKYNRRERKWLKKDLREWRNW